MSAGEVVPPILSGDDFNDVLLAVYDYGKAGRTARAREHMDALAASHEALRAENLRLRETLTELVRTLDWNNLTRCYLDSEEMVRAADDALDEALSAARAVLAAEITAVPWTNAERPPPGSVVNWWVQLHTRGRVGFSGMMHAVPWGRQRAVLVAADTNDYCTNATPLSWTVPPSASPDGTQIISTTMWDAETGGAFRGAGTLFVPATVWPGDTIEFLIGQITMGGGHVDATD